MRKKMMSQTIMLAVHLDHASEKQFANFLAQLRMRNWTTHVNIPTALTKVFDDDEQKLVEKTKLDVAEVARDVGIRNFYGLCLTSNQQAHLF